MAKTPFKGHARQHKWDTAEIKFTHKHKKYYLEDDPSLRPVLPRNGVPISSFLEQAPPRRHIENRSSARAERARAIEQS